MTAFSTIIIGAGAAGLAAGRLLHDAGGSILILEARNRLGGRIWTDHDFADFPIELGAEFIHGDQAVTHNLVRQAGLSIMPAPRLANLWWSEGQRPAVHRDQLPPLIRDMLNGLLKDYEALAEIPSPLPTRGDTPTDLSLADYLRARGWDADALEMADVVLAQTCCANLDSLSCYDLIREIRADHAGHQDSRIRESYAPLLQWYSRDLPIRFNTAVTRIQWGADGVTITAGNEIFRADKCILTIPVSLLQRGMVQFNPPLSAAKQAAVAAFRTQAATKLIYHFQEPLWHESLVYMAHTGLAARWWTPGYGRPDAAVICAYITAERARKLDMMEAGAALALGLDELSQLLGIPVTSLRARCLNAKRVSWADDPWARGGYAHVPPGYADARPVLAASEGGVLFFAGEAAAYDTNPQTVHGALESGWRAARECGA